MKEEEKLAKHQDENLKSNAKKYELVENIMLDGSASRLGRHYGINLAADEG